MSLPTGVAALRARIEQAQSALQARQQHAFASIPTKGTGYAVMKLHGSGSVSRTEIRALGDFQTIAALLATPLPQSVRATLFRVAATIPGVTYSPTARDPLGRAGVAVSVGHGARQSRLIFDPRTGALLANITGPWLSVTVVAQGVVSSINALPPGVRAVRGPSGLEPQVIAISPHIGTAHTAFTIRIPATAGKPRPRTAPQVLLMLFGPPGTACRLFGFGSAAPRITPGTVTTHAGIFSYAYRIAPSDISRRTWCPGRYELQLTPLLPSVQNSTSQSTSAIYFDVR